MQHRTYASRRIEALLFLGFFATFAYFHQGGGWNQNGRFALVRSIVEEGRFAIDDYLVYGAAEGATQKLQRAIVRDGRFLWNGTPHVMAWPDAEGRLVPVDGAPLRDGERLAPLLQAAATGDVAFAAGSFHPNKAPGTSFLAVPAYALLYRIERFVGVDPDDWWTLTCNAWLTTVLSVGLVSALGCVLFFRTALLLSGGRRRASLLATIAFGAGTLFFPYATMLFEHDVVAVALLASFYLMLRFLSNPENPLSPRFAKLAPWLAGIAAGWAAISSYVAVPALLLLAGYLALRSRSSGAVVRFAIGAFLPLALLAAYHTACFGTPLTSAYAHQSPAFLAGEGALFSVFTAPSPGVLLALLFSPFRGLFVSSPVLLLGVLGLIGLFRRSSLRVEAWLFLSLVAFFLLVNSSFNGWHGGAGSMPRYLGPAIPFLALPLVLALERLPSVGTALAVVSVTLASLTTAVDPQCPLGVVPIARVEGRPLWGYSPLTEYELPLLIRGRATPAIEAVVEDGLATVDRHWREEGREEATRRQGLAILRGKWDEAVRTADPEPFLLAGITGPLSVNPIGIYEGWFYTLFPAHGVEADWNSFNAGEFLFPRSRLSLAPLLLLWGAWAILLKRLRAGANLAVTPSEN